MSPSILSVQRVFKAFAEVRAVNGVELEVMPGEILGFLGPNGAGKTTTLRMIMEIIRPDAGEIRFDGKPGLDRKRVGYLPEERGLYEDAGVLETLVYMGTLRGLGRGEARAAGKSWLERLMLSDRAGSKVSALSKGNQQKVQFAGAVLHHPALAVLDEPFAGLDPLNQELFLGLIQELRAQGSAVLLSAHQLNLVERLCDRFSLISRGRVLLTGTLEEIRRRAAGGAGEVLLVDLRPAIGRRVDAAAIEAALGEIGLRVTVEARELSDGLVRIEASLPPGTDLSPILGELSRRFVIERVGTRTLSLHEIYVRAVGADHAPSPETSPEPARV